MKKKFRSISILFLIIFLSTLSVFAEINDDYEKTNRSIHNFNDAIDQNILRPTSKVYGVLPNFIEIGVSNIISNISEPSNIINYLAQGNVSLAFLSTGRLVINSTIGLIGFFDLASKIGVEKNSTDFGKTFQIWGFGEGQFLVIPFLGPRTTRHFIGTAVDIGINPIRIALNEEDTIVSISPSIIYALSERSRNGETIDNLKKTSIDYYSSLKSIYLQNRGINLNNNFEENQDIFEENFDEYYENIDEQK